MEAINADAMQDVLKDYLEHHGVKGQKWGLRRYQNKDGTLTEAGKLRYKDFKEADIDTYKQKIEKFKKRKAKKYIPLPSERVMKKASKYFLNKYKELSRDKENKKIAYSYNRFVKKHFKGLNTKEDPFTYKLENLDKIIKDNLKSKREKELFAELSEKFWSVEKYYKYSEILYAKYNNYSSPESRERAYAAWKIYLDEQIEHILNDSSSVIFIADASNSLTHYGVKGMKWGVRKAVDVAKRAFSNARKKTGERITRTRRSKRFKHLTNEELKARTDRVLMEKTYVDAVRNNRTPVAKMAQDILVSSGKTLLTAVAVYVGGTAINKAFNAKVIYPYETNKKK